MTQYLKPSFTVLLGSKEYAENWDAVFGKKEHYHVTCEECDPPAEATQLQLEKPESLPRVCRTCSEGHGDWPHVHTEVTEDGNVRISRHGGEDDSDE